MENHFKSSRMLSLDFFRGIAIIGVVIVHLVIIGIFFSVDNGLNVLPAAVLAVFTPLIAFAPMAGLFAFISSVANGMSVQQRLNKGYSLSASVQPLWVTGIVLAVIHFIYVAFFKEKMPSLFDEGSAPGGLFPTLLVDRSWGGFSLEHFLMIDAFAMIMESVFLSLILSVFLFREKNSRTTTQKLNFLLIFGIAWTCLSPVLWGLSFKAMRFFYFQENFFLRLPAIPLSFFAGKMHPITTIAPFSVFGLWFAVRLFDTPDYANLRRETRYVGWLMALMALLSLGFKAFLCFAQSTLLFRFLDKIGIVELIAFNTPAKLPHIDPTPSLIAGDYVNSVLSFIVVPPEWVFITMALCFFAYPVLIRVFDYQNNDSKKALAERIKPIRRFATLSLTVFFFECLIQTLFSQFFRRTLVSALKSSTLFSFLFQAPFHLTVKAPTAIYDDFMLMWPLWILYLACAVGFWFLLLRLWEKVGFCGSFEWLISKATAPFRQVKSSKMEAIKNFEIYEGKVTEEKG